MQSVLVVFAFLTLHSLMGQKPSKSIFNYKSYPKFKIDSLSDSYKDSYFLDKLQSLKNDEISLLKRNNTMPIFKPNHESSMPIYDVDSTNTYFLRVYPSAKN
ncbi:hypothetical protein [uncultured Croceitalea sp.]|uniref:hypothetical protein n=1 Tax=uncultured Croceitalea sp. TaxID=1798908 RepID=UPI00374E5B51